MQKRGILTKLCGYLIALLLGTGMVLPAATAEPSSLSDVKDNTAYSEAIYDAVEKGYVRGYQDGSFHPERNVSMQAFLAICCNAYFKSDLEENSKAMPASEAVIETMAQQNLISRYDATYQSCSWSYVLETVMKIHDLPFFSRTAWGDQGSSAEGITIPEMETYCSAVHYGLLRSLDISASQMHDCPKRGELMQLFMNLQDEEALQVRPEIPGDIKIEILDKSVSDSDISTLYEALCLLPEGVLDKFRTKNWTLCISAEKTINELFIEYRNKATATGLASSSLNKIYVCSEVTGLSKRTVLHEFGHFIHMTSSHGPLPVSIFNEEKDSIGASLRSYAATNQDEAFADIFANCCLYRNDNDKIEQIKENIPKSFAYVWETCFKDVK